ncbi:MAG: hypothetical protein QF440_01055 [Candidatus Thalassarchaeaceae archaeon]|jgi:hypothetical protein|nr:hypothetical protein [Candidatus Thalassarchaeaceae archaeon]
MDADTIISKWFSTREQKITWAVSLAFLLIFPLYFSNMAAFLPGNAVVDDTGGSGSWDVKFTETVEDEDSETIEGMEDAEIFELEFSYEDLTSNLAYVKITVSHDESNERGPDPSPGPIPDVTPSWPVQCDTVDVEIDMSDINGYVENGSTTSSSSSDCPSEQVLFIYMIQNYTGMNYNTKGSKNSILASYDDEGLGRGDWYGEIELTVNTGGPNGPTGNRDNGEDVTVSWEIVSTVVEVTKSVEDVGAEV